MKRLLITWCILSALSISGFACSLSPITAHRVGSELSVQVRFRDAPAGGVTVFIKRARDAQDSIGETVATLVTDATGMVHFRGLPLGRFRIETIKGKLDGTSARLRVVKDDSKKETRLEVSWPSSEPLRIQRFAGTLSAPVIHDTGHPLMDLAHASVGKLSQATLSLSDAVSGDLVATGVTDEQGVFSVVSVQPGIYWLRIRQSASQKLAGGEISDSLLIEIDPKHGKPLLSGQIGRGGCGGIEFTDSNDHVGS